MLSFWRSNSPATIPNLIPLRRWHSRRAERGCRCALHAAVLPAGHGCRRGSLCRCVTRRSPPLPSPCSSPSRRRLPKAPDRARARLSSPVFAFVTMPWKYPPGVDRKCEASLAETIPIAIAAFLAAAEAVRRGKQVRLGRTFALGYRTSCSLS